MFAFAWAVRSGFRSISHFMLQIKPLKLESNVGVHVFFSLFSSVYWFPGEKLLFLPISRLKSCHAATLNTKTKQNRKRKRKRRSQVVQCRVLALVSPQLVINYKLFKSAASSSWPHLVNGIISQAKALLGSWQVKHRQAPLTFTCESLVKWIFRLGI